MAKSPLFLERRSYRRRRMMDAVRLLPLLGLALWMVPLMWSVPTPDGQGQGTSVSDALRYVFGIWSVLVVASWALWRMTGEGQDSARSAESANDLGPPP